MRCQVNKFFSSDLNKFLEGKKEFDHKCLEDLFLLCCAVQLDDEKLTIWIDTNSDSNPVAIDIYDDEFGVIDVSKFQSEYLILFGAESKFIQSELHEWNEDEERGQNAVSFSTEDLDLDFLTEQGSKLLDVAKGMSNLGSWHTNLQEFINKVLADF